MILTAKLFDKGTTDASIDDGSAEALASQDFIITLQPEEMCIRDSPMCFRMESQRIWMVQVLTLEELPLFPDLLPDTDELPD